MQILSFVRCALILLVSGGMVESFAACDKCQRPQVVQFDLRVVPARPSDTTDPQLVAKILQWRNLFWASAGVKGYVFNEDPTRECFTHLDGSFYTQGDTAGHSVKFGEEWNNLPPASGQAGGDYLVTGSVDGAQGSYTAEVELQVSKTREVVASASKSFGAADEPMTVGKMAASALGPVVDKIRAFEKSKRASGDPYALWPTAELHPAKTELKEGESVEVELWLYDCDGDIASSPLADRPVQISVTNGTVSQTSVTTGSDGKAKFTFTAGDKPAEALLTATYPFTLASGHESVGHPGYASIRIQEVPATLWKLEGTLIEIREYDETTRSDYAEISEGGRSRSGQVSSFHVRGVLRNLSKDTSNPFKGDQDPVHLQVTGFHNESAISWGYSRMPKFWSRGQAYGTAQGRPRGSRTRPVATFDYFFEPGSEKRAAGGFALWGQEILGESTIYEMACNSEEGCRDQSEPGEISDEISISIPVPESPGKAKKDTSYVDLDKTRVAVTTLTEVAWEDGAFRIEYLSTEQGSRSGEGTVANASYSSYTDKRYVFRLEPLDRDRSTGVRRPANRALERIPSMRSGPGRGRWTVDFQASTEGTIQARLLGLDGRILTQASRRVGAGDRSESFDLPEVDRGMAIAEVVFTDSRGGIRRWTRGLPLLWTVPMPR